MTRLEELQQRVRARRGARPTPNTRPLAARVAAALLGQQRSMASLAHHRDCWIVLYCPDCDRVIAAVLRTPVGDLWVSQSDVIASDTAHHIAVWLDEERVPSAPCAKCTACNVVHYLEAAPTPLDALQRLRAEVNLAHEQRRRQRLPANGSLRGVSPAAKSLPLE